MDADLASFTNSRQVEVGFSTQASSPLTHPGAEKERTSCLGCCHPEFCNSSALFPGKREAPSFGSSGSFGGFSSEGRYGFCRSREATESNWVWLGLERDGPRRRRRSTHLGRIGSRDRGPHPGVRIQARSKAANALRASQISRVHERAVRCRSTGCLRKPRCVRSARDAVRPTQQGNG